MNHLITSMRARVLDRIERDGVRMRSRWFFAAKVAGTVVIALATLALSALVISFLFFSLEEGGEQVLLGFGARGLATFFALFPWHLLMLDLIGIAITWLLVRSFRFSYRSPGLLIVAGILLISIVAGALVNLTPLHTTLREQADREELPLFGDLYRSARHADEARGQYHATVIEIDGQTLIVELDDRDADHDDGTFVVEAPSDADLSGILPGDELYIAGERTETGTIRAYGIGKLFRR